MRFNFILLLISLALLADCGAAFEATQSDTVKLLPQVITSDLTHTVGVAASDNRSLRTAGADDVGGNNEDEERAMGFPKDHVKNLLGNAVLRTDTFQSWAKADLSVETLAKSLKLNQSTHKWIQKLMNANKKDQAKLLALYRAYR